MSDAVIRAPEPGGALDRLDTCPNAVVLRLFPPPLGEGGGLPAEWIDIAGEWVLGDLAPTDSVPLRLLSVEFEVKVANAPAILHQASAAQAWCDIVNGNVDERLRTASITFGKAPHVALAAGGPACDSHALLARFDLLAEVAREYAGGVSYACLDIETTFDGIGLGLANTGWRDQGGASPNLVAGRLSDVLVPDAYPYQILGKGHLARLGRHDERRSARRSSTARWRCSSASRPTGCPSTTTAAEVLEQGWELLAPLLATDQQVADLLGDRPEPIVVDEPEPPEPPEPPARRAPEPRGHHPRDAPARPPGPAPHAARAGGVAGPRAAQRRAGERVAGARHLRPLVRVGARRRAPPDPEGPRPPARRHHLAGRPAGEHRPAAPSADDSAARGWPPTGSSACRRRRG